MNYIAELNAFERLLETVRLSGNAQLLWYKLMCLANKSNWAEWIEVDNGRLESILGCGNKTLIRARDKLIEKHFIEYRRGKGRGVGKYKIISLMCKNDTTNDTSNDTSSDTSKQKKEKKQKKENNNIINKNKTEKEIDKEKGAAVLKSYRENIGETSPYIHDKLLEWANVVDESLILYAIEQAAAYGKCTYSYVEAILQSHFKSGRKTREKAEQVNRMRRENSDKPKSRYDYDELERKMFANVTKGANSV